MLMYCDLLTHFFELVTCVNTHDFNGTLKVRKFAVMSHKYVCDQVKELPFCQPHKM